MYVLHVDKFKVSPDSIPDHQKNRHLIWCQKWYLDEVIQPILRIDFSGWIMMMSTQRHLFGTYLVFFEMRKWIHDDVIWSIYTYIYICIDLFQPPNKKHHFCRSRFRWATYLALIPLWFGKCFFCSSSAPEFATGEFWHIGSPFWSLWVPWSDKVIDLVWHQQKQKSWK